MREADEIIVTDTGLPMERKKLRELGAVVHIHKVEPWRFDIARNIALPMCRKMLISAFHAI